MHFICQPTIQDITADYAEMQMNLFSVPGGLLPSDHKQMLYLQQQERADLAKVMTPEELAGYDLRSSPTASKLGYELVAFDASEDEYKAILRAKQQAEQSPGAGANQMAQTARADLADQQIAAALGPDRFAEYKRDTDSSYLQAYYLAQRLNLPATAPAQVYAVAQEVKAQQAAVIANSALSPEDRQAQLSRISEATHERVHAILGPDGANAWLESIGSAFLRHPAGPPTANAPSGSVVVRP